MFYSLNATFWQPELQFENLCRIFSPIFSAFLEY